MLFLGHRFPNVRKATAEALYLKLLANEAIVDEVLLLPCMYRKPSRGEQARFALVLGCCLLTKTTINISNNNDNNNSIRYPIIASIAWKCFRLCLVSLAPAPPFLMGLVRSTAQ